MSISSKVGIIGGAGLLGSTAAFLIALEEVADEIVLVDMKANLAEAHAMDMGQSVCEHSDTQIFSGGFSDLKDCDVVINVAGIPEMKAGSRNDYLSGNTAVYKDIADQIKKWDKCPVILSASNPIDVLNYRLFEMSGLPREKLVGFSRNDSLRFIWSTALETGISAKNINGLVIGEHGEAQVPLFGSLRYVDSGLPIGIDEKQKESILMRVNNYFGDYQKLESGRSSGWTSGVGLCSVVKLILSDSDEQCPCSIIPAGEYGMSEVSIGLPVKLGRNGVREVMNINLSEDERARLKVAEDKIKGLIDLSRTF